MKVVDASVVVDLVCFDLDPDQIGDHDLAAPHLLDSEVLQSIRRCIRSGELTERRAEHGLGMFADLKILRHPAAPLRRRIWALRHNLTAYDATYVALTEALGAAALVTRDEPLSQAPGPLCRVELI